MLFVVAFTPLWVDPHQFWARPMSASTSHSTRLFLDALWINPTRL